MKLILLSCTLLVLVFGPAHVASAQAPAGGSPWYESILVNGFFSAAYSYNFNAPSNLMTPYHVFDADANAFTVNAAEICVRKEAAQPGEAGFRLDLVGGSVARVMRSATNDAGDFDIEQVMVTYIAPVGRGLRIDAGRFVSPLGYEVTEGWDGFNDNFTRSFLFGYAVPFTLTGINATYGLSASTSLSAMIVNGWNGIAENNSSKTVGAMIQTSPVNRLVVRAGMLYGPERDGNNSDNRTMADLSATYAVGSMGVFGINVNIGSEPGAAIGGGDASWSGVAGYLRLTLSKMFALAFRLEHFNDANGARTGRAQKLSEVTLTPEFRAGENIVFRADIRYDKSSREDFVRDGTPSKSQLTLGLNGIYVF